MLRIWLKIKGVWDKMGEPKAYTPTPDYVYFGQGPGEADGSEEYMGQGPGE